MFEATVTRCMEEGLVGGQGFAVDASLISADVQKQSSSNPEDWAAREIDPTDAPRAVREYLDTLDDEAFGAATTEKQSSPPMPIQPVSGRQRVKARLSLLIPTTI